MKRDELVFDLMPSGNYHAVFRNKHGRKIYLQVQRKEDCLSFAECCYIDRPFKGGEYPAPKKFRGERCSLSELIEIIATTLDKRFYKISFSSETSPISREEYIESKLRSHKYKFLIFVQEGSSLKTRLKSRVHREIYIEINLTTETSAYISDCHYCDRNYRNIGRVVTPVGLTTIFFCPTKENILRIVNDELNCDFTDVIVTSDTFGFSERDIPICGSI